MTLIKSISGIRGTVGGAQAGNLTPPDVVKFTRPTPVSPPAATRAKNLP